MLDATGSTRRLRKVLPHIHPALSGRNSIDEVSSGID